MGNFSFQNVQINRCIIRIIDVRYKFEYDGGHIEGAENWVHGEDEEFLSAFLPNEALTEPPVASEDKTEKRNIIIFHCEFSSQRAPDFYNKLRERDRQELQRRFFVDIFIWWVGGGALYRIYYSQLISL